MRACSSMFWIAAALAALTGLHCGSGDNGSPQAAASRPTHCGPLPVAPDVVEPIELLFGATNVNAALGSGGLTAGFSSCGELTVLKWPGPSYHDQLDYLSSNAPDARRLEHFGALETQGAFAGIAYQAEGSGWHLTWLRDGGWEHRQRYSRDDSDVLVQETRQRTLGLKVTAHHFVLPDDDVLVNDYAVERLPGSPVRAARMVYYANFAPTLARLPFFPLADWALDFQNDFAAVWDADERAVLHFRPASVSGAPRDFGAVDELLRDPPADPARLQEQVQAIIATLAEPGVYIALGAGADDVQHQVGFDDAPSCAHQSEFGERMIAALGLGPALEPLARTLFVCDATVSHPDGPLGQCRDANGWTYTAESAYADAGDGNLSGSPLAACRANAALAQPLSFAGDMARATFYVSAAATRDAAYASLQAARAADPDAQRAAAEEWWSRFLAPAQLPDTDDALVTAFAKRSLIAIRTAADRASGAIVASIATQPPYGEDWPRDGAFINYALDRAGYADLVTAHNRFYARVQRQVPSGWSPFYSFPACDAGMPVYPDCIPAGTFEQNYYADPHAIVPGGPTSFEIDETGLVVWTLWDHAAYLGDADEHGAYLADACPAIRLGAATLAACRDAATGLQCPANEDDNIELTQGLQGAETALLGLESAAAAAAECGFPAADEAAWRERAAELRAAIAARFLVPGPPAHLEGARAAWALWPVGFFALSDPGARTHAEWLGGSLDALLRREPARTGYDAQDLLARAVLARFLDDQAGLAEAQAQVRFLVRELTTPDTLHMGEFSVRVPADLNGDGIAPDYLPANAVPHVWEQSYVYAAALEAFGSR